MKSGPLTVWPGVGSIIPEMGDANRSNLATPAAGLFSSY